MSYRSSLFHTVFFVLIGAGLLIGGGVCAKTIVSEISNTTVATIFIVLTSVPLIFFGLYIAISAIRYEIIFLTDAISIKEGFSTTTIQRSEICDYCINKKRTQLELMLEPPRKRYAVPLAINLDKEFYDWFEGINRVPEFNEPQLFNADIYPRQYKSSRGTLIFLELAVFIWLGGWRKVLLHILE